ncbi:sulfatase-like hydrolase/transferase [Candidatus Uabimicrobium sp. HlEnr_7]|uniref:sulfatase-like hydrolase/transferase n=1 Tax=Candidatus Uabimicrobium helgolandensis TaxID=3095367 RepID=UPI003557ADB4
MKKIIFVIAGVAIIISGWMLFSTQNSQNYNLVLISVDTLRADRLGCYGYSVAQTPNIDNLASESVLFEKCFAQTPLTFPSHISIMTGTNPTTHNVKDNLYYAFDEAKLPTMASILKTYFYQTAAIVSAAPLNKSKRLNKGFDWYSDVEDNAIEDNSKFVAERAAVASVEIANEYLDKMSQKSLPFFLWLHLFDPHAEYKAPQRFAESFVHPYDAEIAYTDYCLGLLFDKLKELGQYENTIIVFVSDHGEGLGEHGELSHGYFTYNSTLHVPLMFKVPGISKKRLSFPVSTIDILPTVMSLLRKKNLSDKVGISPVSEGYDLSAHFTSNKKFPILDCYGESYYAYNVFGWSIMRSLTSGDYKYIATKKGELYNIVDDMHEKNNLVTDQKYQNIVEEMKGKLIHVSKNTGISQTLNMDEDKAAMAAIGYLQGSQPKIAPTEGPDPVEMKDILKLVTNAQTQMVLRRYDQCEKILNHIIEKDPNNIMAWMLLGKLYTQVNNFAKSIVAFKKMEDLCVTSRFARNGQIDALIQLGRFSDAEVLIEKTFKENEADKDAFLHSRKAYVLLQREKYEDAERSARTASSLDSDLPSAQFYLARSLQLQKKYSVADKEFIKAIKLQKHHPQAYYYWGECLLAMDKKEQAKQCFKIAIQQNPQLREKVLELLRK